MPWASTYGGYGWPTRHRLLWFPLYGGLAGKYRGRNEIVGSGTLVLLGFSGSKERKRGRWLGSGLWAAA